MHHHTRKKRNHNKSKGGSKNKSNALKKTTSSKKSRKINKRKIGGASFMSALTSAFRSSAPTNDSIGDVDKFDRHGPVTDYDRELARQASSLSKDEFEKIIQDIKELPSYNEEYFEVVSVISIIIDCISITLSFILLL